MTNRKDIKEKRKHRRFKVKEGAFAVSSPFNDRLGRIKDVSKGGLAFQYVGNTESTQAFHEVEIFSARDGFYLKKLPASTVVDVELDNQVSFASLPTRQLRVQFGKLNHQQRLLLDHFIQKYTQR
ncbi:MAG: PilZ domain-containing protein [Desulfobacterales bacterium]|nr:MAG: PilZ domain-containing protein [Desulfobacterales bacterium]